MGFINKLEYPFFCSVGSTPKVYKKQYGLGANFFLNSSIIFTIGACFLRKSMPKQRSFRPPARISLIRV